MKILVFPSHNDTYNSIVIDTDNLELDSEFGINVKMPTIYLDDLISDLISQN